ncbi:hypothetical protein [Bosea sp. (in: a-proteobacteria)]|uniref:hypothetical protein n=1 Tax=Bosea sp. (in: a-proteobacteria) TaxID=1871050 RepID=UPI00273509E9|nr:hypothetical protein [Bosea sp. (in: a-proteobacteria)]MDP3409238.1 hypothetical protein [Bosea sp. (in: a-proteobacteria)]
MSPYQRLGQIAQRYSRRYHALRRALPFELIAELASAELRIVQTCGYPEGHIRASALYMISTDETQQAFLISENPDITNTASEEPEIIKLNLQMSDAYRKLELINYYSTRSLTITYEVNFETNWITFLDIPLIGKPIKFLEQH